MCEITELLDLSSRPQGTRVIVRRERAHPGAQLSFTDHDGHRFQAILTHQTGDIAALERDHRGRARVEDQIRNDKDTGVRNLPFRAFAHNQSARSRSGHSRRRTRDNDDGFTVGESFQNYGGYPTREQFANAFTTPVTNGQVSINGQPILLPRYETFYSKYNNPGGFCYGFAYLTGERASLGSPLDAGLDPFHADTKSIDQAGIQSDWWRQLSDESQASYTGEHYQSVSQVRTALAGVSWNSPVIISLRWHETTVYPSGRVVETDQAHAILAFAVQDTSALHPPGDFTIYTYNSNDPYMGGEGSGTAHAKALTSSDVVFATDGQWSFPEFPLTDGDRR